jgi:regulator of protease activity HflC (stomatin/prohibitin superfamily)
MKKYLTIFLSFVLCLFLFGCDYSPFYTVSVTEKAIITQNGKIIGEPKKAGLHFKIPILQQVHLIDVYRVRIFNLPIEHSTDFEAKIMCSIKDIKKFFIAMQKGEITKSIKPAIEPEFNEIMDEYSQEKVSLIYKSQEEKTKYANEELDKISAYIQEAIDDFGVKIVDIYFEYNKSVAQQINSDDCQGRPALAS